jgi:hypothetical protein
MGSVIHAYKLSLEARRRLEAKAALPVPREVHVHPNGRAVALYERHGDMHFESLFGLLDYHGLAQRDLIDADPYVPRDSRM